MPEFTLVLKIELAGSGRECLSSLFSMLGPGAVCLRGSWWLCCGYLWGLFWGLLGGRVATLRPRQEPVTISGLTGFPEVRVFVGIQGALKPPEIRVVITVLWRPLLSEPLNPSSQSQIQPEPPEPHQRSH